MTPKAKNKTHLTLPSDTEIKIVRTFNAPRQRVWDAYTKAEHLVKWWGPTGWTLPVCELEFKVGGEWFYCMENADLDMRSCARATFITIDAPDSFSYQDAFADNDGVIDETMPVATSHYTFVEDDGKTTVTNVSTYSTKAERDTVIEMGVEAGISQTLDRLEAFLAE